MERQIGVKMYRFTVAAPNNSLLLTGLTLCKQPTTNLFALELPRDYFGSVNANPKQHR
jgi:hypothetical protein